MLQEYAVDPELAAIPANLRAISLLFNYSNPRRISNFPLTWARSVMEHAKSIGQMEEKHAEILLKHMQQESLCIRSFGRAYNQALDWKGNTANQHSNKPFHAILCDSGVGDVPSLEIHAANPRLDAPYTWPLTKTYANLTSLLLPLLKEANYVCIIDPYYSPFNNAYKRLFSDCFEVLNNRSDAANITANICTSSNRPMAVYGAGEQRKLKQDFISHYIPNICRIQVVGSLREDMHARYLITDVASFVIDHGFDVKDNITANVTMLSASDANNIKRQYFSGP